MYSHPSNTIIITHKTPSRRAAYTFGEQKERNLNNPFLHRPIRFHDPSDREHLKTTMLPVDKTGVFPYYCGELGVSLKVTSLYRRLPAGLPPASRKL